MLTDPKALQYILHTSGYRFPKRADAVETTRLILGQGLVWAHGATSLLSSLRAVTLNSVRRDPPTPEENHEPCFHRSAAQVLPRCIPAARYKGM